MIDVKIIFLLLFLFVSLIFPIFALSFGEMDDNIEESYKALTRQRIWKIQRVRAKSLKAVPPAVAYILLSPRWSQLTYIPAGVS